MTDPPLEQKERTLVGVSFGDAFRAQEFLTAATRLAANQRLKLLDAVFVTKDDSGHTTVRETVDPTPGRSAFSGALWAGLFGLILGGPVGWAIGAGVGAGTGVVAAKVIDHGVSDEWVAWFRDTVQSGTTTLVLLVEDLDRDAAGGRAEALRGGHAGVRQPRPRLARPHPRRAVPLTGGDTPPGELAALSAAMTRPTAASSGLI